MSRIAACLLALFLCWPAYASTKSTQQAELECITAADVKRMLSEGLIQRLGMGMNDNGDLLILWKTPGGGFWLSWMKQDDDRACTLGSGPLWLYDPVGDGT